MRRMLDREDIDAIKAIVDDRKSGRNRTGLARAIGVANSAITELLAGERDLKKSEIAPLQKYLKVILPSVRKIMPSVQLREEEAMPQSIIPQVRMAPVRGRAAGGVWLEIDVVDEEVVAEVPYVPTRYSHMEQFAFRVGGSSMEAERIFDGDYVICVEYALVRGFPQQGDVVVAERRRGGLTERSCKRIERDDKGAFSLVSCPIDPSMRQAIPLAVAQEEVSVEVVGLVVGSFRPRWL